MQKLEAMHNIFNPRSVAFVGASNTFTKWGFQILHNLLMAEYPGKVYPVNPSQKEILGHTAYPSVSAIPDPVDLAIFTIPAPKLPDAITDCVRKGIPAGLVISAGFAELGDEGARLEREMTQRARAGGMVLVGPNCQGTAYPAAHFYPWMPAHFPKQGSISIVSQSGNILTWLGQNLEDYGFGVAKAVSCGNLCDLDWDDYLLYLENDSETRVIFLYIEGIRDGRRFFEVAKKVNRTKPILVFKGGQSQEGYRAARSHT
jgi:acyl-CoA synthetase (NDP forming)